VAAPRLDECLMIYSRRWSQAQDRQAEHSVQGGSMFVTVVYVRVKPENVADFIEAVRENHEQSVREPGNLRFDILQSADDTTRFVAYEAYRDEASAKAHKETAH
jgi:autoinducer 2-degrading protein